MRDKHGRVSDRVCLSCYIKARRLQTVGVISFGLFVTRHGRNYWTLWLAMDQADVGRDGGKMWGLWYS